MVSRCRTTTTKASRSLRYLAIAGIAALAACQGDSSNGPDPDTELPAWASNFLSSAWATFPTEAQQVWKLCQDEAKVGVAGQPYASGVNCRLALVDGFPRRYVVYVPEHPALAAGNVPVVVMHHGSSGSGEQFLDISGWREQADEQGFIAIFPSGLLYEVIGEGKRTKWNDFDLPGLIDPGFRHPGYPANAPWPANDVLFERVVLDDAAASAAIDQQRIYVTGFSGGAAFTARLAVELSDRIAAAAPFAGAFTGPHVPLERIPIMIGVGTRDDRIIQTVNAALPPGQDSVSELPLDFDSLFALEAVAAVRDAVAASFGSLPSSYTAEGDATFARARFAAPVSGNTDGNVFVFGIVKDVTHQYPRGEGRRRPPNNPAGFDAARTFWAFFSPIHK